MGASGGCITCAAISHRSVILWNSIRRSRTSTGCLSGSKQSLRPGSSWRQEPREIERLLGARSPGHQLDITELSDLYKTCRDVPGVRLKRELWAKLLTTAQGAAFRDDDLLFVQHTLLVITAEIIAHAVLDIDPRTLAPLALVTGQQFRMAKVLGVVEADFFDWPAEVPDGAPIVRALARRLSRFAWAHVEHDVLKVLYESVIPTQQRKQLGEYYTPDWLAEKVVETTIASPLESRVVDPSCGSGTFVFYAVRRYLEAADAAGVKNKDALSGVCNHVMGMDLHPVAVTLARVTYLLAIGAERLKQGRGPISIPVFLGDSLQWGQEETLQTRGALVVSTDDGLMLFPAELRFPDSIVADAGRFDALVAEMAEKASQRQPGSAVPSLRPLFRLHGVKPEEQSVLETTFRTMCSLHDQGRDHIWGYYVRNLARPRWLARDENHVDVLVGNPPWLSYRYMTASMQKDFSRLLKDRDLWPGAKSVTHVDLSALFVVRCIERYLRVGGSFAFVMPLAVLSRQHFSGFRTGSWQRPQGFPVCAAFDTPWDLHRVKPTFFEVPCSVVRGRRAENEFNALPVPSGAEGWQGVLPAKNLTWSAAQPHIRVTTQNITAASTAVAVSEYAPRFTQGAILVPRMLFLVDEEAAGPLGVPTGSVRVRSRRSAKEKTPWRALPALQGAVEREFVFPVHLGDTIMPFRPLEPFRCVLPLVGRRLYRASDEVIAQFPGLQEWATKVEETWNGNRSSDKLTLLQQLDYRQKLSAQLTARGSGADVRVVYTKSGMYLAAAVVDDPGAVIDHKLYWAACATRDEADYLCAILNSERLTLGVRAFQARGEHNPRDFDMYVWQLPIPMYDPVSTHHRELAALGRDASRIATTLDLPETRFEKQRRFVRTAIAATDTGRAIEEAVRGLLG
jgi:hypothetical protein